MSDSQILITLRQQAKERAIGALKKYQQTLWGESDSVDVLLNTAARIIEDIEDHLG